MNNIKILSKVNDVLDRSREQSSYTSYEDKRAYYDAIASGNADAINELCTANYEYPTRVFERSGSYSGAVEAYRYEAICAASEFCLLSIQNGVPDMVAYDIRDRYISDIGKAVALPDIFYLLHGMAYDLARRVRFTRVDVSISPKVRKMMSFIEDNLTKPISLQDVADAAGLSRTYASTLFSEKLGVSMNEFILNERIGEAKRLLRADDYTISEIAEKLQFCSPSYFSKCFRDKEGLSPQKYRTDV
ncbi:MAG: helix-turn-helix transcriptional regulator [Clostridiales bacterium]|nr:helix-turn-helix transcriptional regulator [Candidatus Crickella caballi]